MGFAVDDDGVTGRRSIIIKQQEEFYHALGPLGLGPIIHREAQVNNAGILVGELVLEADGFLGSKARQRLSDCPKTDSKN